MKLPSVVPMPWRYRQAVGRTGETRLGRLTALVGVGYFFVWTAFGMAAFPLGVALAASEMQQPALARAVPFAGVRGSVKGAGATLVMPLAMALSSATFEIATRSFER
jgi:predicted metal-binding membrane protein